MASQRRTIHVSLSWLLIGLGLVAAAIILASQSGINLKLKTAASSSKSCQLDYNKPAVKQKISCIIKSASSRLDAYVVSTTLKVTAKGTGTPPLWEAKATCRLLCDCNSVSARPESNPNTCTDALGDNFRAIESSPVCNVPSSYKVPYNYATTITVEAKDKFEAIRRLNERCDAYERVRTNTCSSECISKMPTSIKNIQAEVSCMQCKASPTPTPTPKSTPKPKPKTTPSVNSSNILKRMAEYCKSRGWAFQNNGTSIRCGDLSYADYVRLESRWRISNPSLPK